MDGEVENLVQCAEFLNDARYCMNYGWTQASEAEVQAELVEAAEESSTLARRGAHVDETGDLSLPAMIDRFNAMSPDERAAAARLELQDAAYVTLDISGHTYAQWYRLNVNHYSTWGTPVILHPILLKEYFPYLDDDGSGHFQLGRGWDFESSKDDSWQIKYYEPWNQQRFNPSERFIARQQTRWAKNSFLANKNHFQHNIGV